MNCFVIVVIEKGDGLEDQRLQNQTLYNITFADDELKGNVTDNPDLWMYQTVYVMSFVILIVTGMVKGIGLTFG